MDDYCYRDHHAAPPYSLTHNTLALPSSLSTSYNPNVSHGLLSDGIPSFDFGQYDPFLISTDQQSFPSIMVNEGFDQFDPLYASLDLPNHDSPLSPNTLQVCARPSIDSSESIVTESFGSLLPWGDSVVTKELDTGVALLCHQNHRPVQVINDTDTKSCEIIPTEKDGMKKESGQSGRRPKKSRNRSARAMTRHDVNGTMNNNSAADALTWEILSQYFYMPIAQAARELNIGLTLFKKRCRELGVRRWPHRKLMSIKSLIKNVKDMEKEGRMDPTLSKGTVRNAIELLENQRKLMEVMPDVELEAQTKRLRQACFKANYKKRRLMIMNGGGLDNSSGCSSSNQGYESNNNGGTDGQDMEENDELRSLLFDSLSPSDCSFLNDHHI